MNSKIKVVKNNTIDLHLEDAPIKPMIRNNDS